MVCSLLVILLVVLQVSGPCNDVVWNFGIEQPQLGIGQDMFGVPDSIQCG